MKILVRKGDKISQYDDVKEIAREENKVIFNELKTFSNGEKVPVNLFKIEFISNDDANIGFNAILKQVDDRKAYITLNLDNIGSEGEII